MTELEQLRAENAMLVDALQKAGLDFGRIATADWDSHLRTYAAEIGENCTRYALAQSPRSVAWLDAFNAMEEGLKASCYCEDPAYRSVDPCSACKALDRARMLREGGS